MNSSERYERGECSERVLNTEYTQIACFTVFWNAMNGVNVVNAFCAFRNALNALKAFRTR